MLNLEGKKVFQEGNGKRKTCLKYLNQNFPPTIKEFKGIHFKQKDNDHRWNV